MPMVAACVLLSQQRQKLHQHHRTTSTLSFGRNQHLPISALHKSTVQCVWQLSQAQRHNLPSSPPLCFFDLGYYTFHVHNDTDCSLAPACSTAVISGHCIYPSQSLNSRPIIVRSSRPSVHSQSGASRNISASTSTAFCILTTPPLSPVFTPPTRNLS